MSGGQIAALIIAGAVVVLVLVLAVPILRLRHTVDAATRALTDLTDRTGPILSKVDLTVANLNTTLGQVQDSLDGVNAQLAHVDTIASHASQVSANVANLSTVVTAAAANPLVKVTALGYGVRKAISNRRRSDTEREVRTELKSRRRARKRGEA